MSAQALAEAFAPAEARHHENVRRETWGHLAPVRNRTYRGRVVYAVGCYGDDPLNPTILVSEWPWRTTPRNWIVDAWAMGDGGYFVKRTREVGNGWRY